MKKKILALLLGSMMVLSTACGSSDSSEADTSKADDTTASESASDSTTTGGIAKEDIKVGFVYIGDINDGGYTQGHDQGRLALEAMGIECEYLESIPETDADCKSAIENLIDDGCNVIYTTSFNYMNATLAAAAEHPEIKFGHGTGYQRAENVSTYMGKAYQPRYLSGIVAGMKTESNQIGYVAAYPIPEVIRAINAFTLGVQSVNPDATVEVVFTNTWYDPSVEKQAAQQLLNKGCDVMSQHQDSTATQTAAEEAGAFAIGYDMPAPTAAPKAYLTAVLFHWDKFYVEDVQSIIDGTWTSRDYWEGLSAGMVSLDSLTDLCAEGTQEKVDAAQAAILDGSFEPFTGPIKDQNGEVKIADGVKMADADIYNMDWFIEGVIGTIK